jgi:cell division protein FtsQ
VSALNPVSPPGAAHSSASARMRLVLPRPLRRVARFYGRLTSGEIELPRFAATIASVALIGSAGLYGVILGGHSSTVMQTISSRTGFAIEEIRVTGNRETSEIDVFEAVGLDGWTALVGFDVTSARSRIAKLPWVESIAVRKVYPSRLDVEIAERTPFAIWQHGRQLTLIDANGRVIAPFSGRRHAGLPRVIGMGAQENAADFLSLMQFHPEIVSRTVGYIRVADRRWDLRLDNGMTVRLPEEGEDAALAELIELDRRHDLFSREVESVDLRIPDRIVVRLTEEGVDGLEAALKRRLGSRFSWERRT